MRSVTAGGESGDEWIARQRSEIDAGLRDSGFTMADITSQKWQWPTLGKYMLDKQPGGVTTSHQDFLKSFAYGNWREYSAMSHGAFEGLMPIAMYYVADTMPLEKRPKLDEVFERILFMHIGQSSRRVAVHRH